MPRLTVFLAIPLAVAMTESNASRAQAPKPAPNYDESRVPPYTLPDPLTARNGQKITTADEWKAHRRPEILQQFAIEEFGLTPPYTFGTRAVKTEEARDALGGTAIRRQVTLSFGPAADGPKMHLLMYLPAKAQGPVPAFLALNFQGNQAVNADPAIAL